MSGIIDKVGKHDQEIADILLACMIVWKLISIIIGSIVMVLAISFLGYCAVTNALSAIGL